MFHSVEKPVEAVENSYFTQYSTKERKKTEEKRPETKIFEGCFK